MGWLYNPIFSLQTSSQHEHTCFDNIGGGTYITNVCQSDPLVSNLLTAWEALNVIKDDQEKDTMD